LVIFGITGDLSTRKLLPAIQQIIDDEAADLSIVGVSRRDVEVSELAAKAGTPSLAGHIDMFQMDLASPEDYIRLKEYLPEGPLVVYLSVPPNAAADIVDMLGEAGLNDSSVKILFEKPFGYDLATAQDFIARTSRYFKEEQLYRIDHYMAKELAQEIISLRRDAQNKHHGWSNQTIRSIEVVAAETLGVEDRGIFYEQTGALRDFTQGHLMQLLTLFIMEVPAGFPLSDLPEHRLNALRTLEIADPRRSIRGQYHGYDEAVGNPGSQTETLAVVELTSEQERWSGVNFRLATAKAVSAKRSYITVTYIDGTEETFEEAALLREARIPDAYERVLLEAIGGRKELFTTGPEVLRSWELLSAVQEDWAMGNQPLISYEPGSDINTLIADNTTTA
jgi:glucose-6-phosphate 1-dehydrogenase